MTVRDRSKIKSRIRKDAAFFWYSVFQIVSCGFYILFAQKWWTDQVPRPIDKACRKHFSQLYVLVRRQNLLDS